MSEPLQFALLYVVAAVGGFVFMLVIDDRDRQLRPPTPWPKRIGAALILPLIPIVGHFACFIGLLAIPIALAEAVYVAGRYIWRTATA